MSHAWVEAFLARDRNEGATTRGYYNENHLVERDGARMIVRVAIAGAPVMDLKRIPERETLALLARHDFPAPRVLAEGDGWLLLRYVEGTPLHLAHSRGGPLPDWIAPHAARLLRRLHALDAAPLARHCEDLARSPDTRGLFASLLAFAESLHARLAPRVAPALAALGVPARPYDAVRPLAERLGPRPFALCHVDAHRKNLVVTPDERLVPVDWELALVADPLYDVAVHFHRMRYAPAQEAAFLDAYGVPEARPEVDAYLALEAAKSCIGDFARYAEEYRAGASEADRALLADHYLGKLRRAWPLWHPHEKPPSVDEVRRALESAAVAAPEDERAAFRVFASSRRSEE